MDVDAEPQPLRFAILIVLERAGRPLSAGEIADELARLALEGQRIALGSTRERGH